MKKIKKGLISLLVALSLLSTGEIPVINHNINVVEAASIRLSKTKVTIKKGKSVTLKVSGTRKKVKWSTSNKKVATVNSKGKVTAKAKGKATIYAKVNKRTYKCVVTVSVPKTASKNKVTSYVYVTRTGKKYHRIAKCGNTKSSSKVSLSTAKKRGLGPCKKCYR